MKIASFPIITLVALAGGSACSQAGPSTTVQVEVAPVSYPGLTNVCYDIEVKNGSPTATENVAGRTAERVWQESGVCSQRYGNGAGGDIAYIGTCDASVPDDNYALLTLADVYAGGTTALADQLDVGSSGDAEYQNPCPTGAPCKLHFACQENADVEVRFDLVIMRDANQGFFDVAVNFDDIFCSAKVDTCYPGSDPLSHGDDTFIDLLHAADGARHHTAVLGLACTGGALNGNGDVTQLFLNDLVVSCPAAGTNPAFTVNLDPSLVSAGNAYGATAVPADNTTTPPTPAIPAVGAVTSGTVWQYAVYSGQEDLACGAGGPGSCDQVYWNVAFGIEGLPAGCTLSTTATAAAGLLNPAVPGGLTPVGTTWPVIEVNAVPLTHTVAGASVVQCGQYPLDASGNFVKSAYTPVDAPATFTHSSLQLHSGAALLTALDRDAALAQAQQFTVTGVKIISDFVGGALWSPDFTSYYDLIDTFRFDATGNKEIKCSDLGSGGPQIYYRAFSDKRAPIGNIRRCDNLLWDNSLSGTFYVQVYAANPAAPTTLFPWGNFVECRKDGAAATCGIDNSYLGTRHAYELSVLADCADPDVATTCSDEFDSGRSDALTEATNNVCAFASYSANCCTGDACMDVQRCIDQCASGDTLGGLYEAGYSAGWAATCGAFTCPL